MSRNSRKVTVWSALSVDEDIRPYYFDDPIMDRESYLRLLPQYILPILHILSEKTIL